MLLLGVSSVDGAAVRFVGGEPDNAGNVVKTVRAGGAAKNAIDSVAVMLQDAGYLNASVKVVDDTVVVEAGMRSVLVAIIDSSGTVLRENIDRPFVQGVVEQELDRLLDVYRDDGYYYVQARVLSVRMEAERVSLVVSFNRGPIMTVQSVAITGLERTSDEIVRNYLSIDSGDTVSARAVEQWAQEASQVEFVEFIRPIDITPRPGFTGVDVALQFVEKQSARIEGAAGYIPDDPTGLVWTVDVALLNLFGGGRRADIRSERRERGRNLFEVGYRQPIFVLGTGQAGFSVATRDYRDDFYEFAIDAFADAQLFESFSFGVNAGWKTVEPSTNLAGYRRVLAGFTVARRSVDNPLNPRSGLDLRWRIEYANRRYRIDSLTIAPPRTSLNDTRTDATIDWYVPMVGPLVGRLGVRYQGLETTEELPPLSELILVGGPGTIRGYRNEQFAVLRAATGSLEPRVRFDAGYIFGFYDAAYINERRLVGDGIETVEDYLQSFGIGLALTGQSRSGSRSIELSLGWSEGAAFDEPRLSVNLEAGL